MIPNVIHLVHFGSPISEEIIINANSFIENGHEVRIWSEACVLSDLGIDAIKLKEECGTWASVSNIVRLAILLKYGGTYADCDVECIKSFAPLLKHQAFIAKQPDGCFCNAILGAEANHPWIAWQLEIVTALQPTNDASFACHCVMDSPLEGVTVLPADYFYSWNWDEDPKPASPNAYALHFWNGSWAKGV